MIYPSVIISFALIVLIALVAFIVPVFAKIVQGVRRPAADDHAVSRSASRTSSPATGTC